jgi:hypothetical protein
MTRVGESDASYKDSACAGGGGEAMSEATGLAAAGRHWLGPPERRFATPILRES